MLLKEKSNIYLGCVIFIIFGIFQYGIHKICGFTLIPDEFGYWASAANAVGYDWSSVASLGSYYSFGYSFLLIPILKLFHGGTIAYRAAVAVNMLFVCGSLFLLLGILKRVFPKMNRVKSVLVSGIAVLYPSWIFYMQMTMTEALLMFLFILITYLFTSLMAKPKIVTTVLLSVALAYIYCVHMRTVGILIACVITFFVWSVVERPGVKTILIFFGLLLLFFVFAAVLKKSTISSVFSEADISVLSGNDYGGQWEKLRQIVTIRGMKQFLKEAAAKIFYLGLASFGIFYWGIGLAIKKSISLIKKCLKKEKGETNEWVLLFLALSAFGEVLISSVYMYQGSAIDTLIYGRYDEFLVPVFLVIGIAAMCNSRWLFQGTLIMGTVTGLFSLVILNMVDAGEMTGLRGYMVAGISYLLKENNPNVYLFFRDTWILGFGVMLFTSLLVWLSEKGEGESRAWTLAGIIVLEIIAGLQISYHYTYRVNDSNFLDLRIAEEIQDKAGEEDRIVYLDEGEPEYIDFIQMQLEAKRINVICETDDVWKELMGQGNGGTETQELFLITYIDTEYKEELERLFDKCITSNTFRLYYNISEDALNETDYTNSLLQ